jgi:hypothetical protein
MLKRFRKKEENQRKAGRTREKREPEKRKKSNRKLLECPNTGRTKTTTK